MPCLSSVSRWYRRIYGLLAVLGGHEKDGRRVIGEAVAILKEKEAAVAGKRRKLAIGIERAC